MALVAQNLGFYYSDENWLFRDVSFQVERGEIMGIFGYSGCGKTSLAKILADYCKPKEGQVLIDGEKHREKTFREVQLIYQHPEKAMNPMWRMKDILEEGYIPEEDIKEKFGIREEWMNRYPVELSGGEQQRFAIVRALHPKTKYIICDEMTTMLDAITQAFLWKKLVEISKKRQLGIIIISHEMALIRRLCDRCFYMEEEKVYKYGK